MESKRNYTADYKENIESGNYLKTDEKSSLEGKAFETESTPLKKESESKRRNQGKSIRIYKKFQCNRIIFTPLLKSEIKKQ